MILFCCRLFGLIESSSSENARVDISNQQKMSHEEAMLEVGMLSTFNAIMQQSSKQIFQVGLNYIYDAS